MTDAAHNWLDAGKSKAANKYIHPAGGQSDEAYWSSGQDDARTIQHKIGCVGSVLEFGCGNGRILKHLSHPKAYGVDISPDLVAGLNNACLVSEFTGTVDAVYSMSVFIHLNRHEAVEALQWIYDHLNPGGKAFLQVPIYSEDREPDSFIDVGVWSPVAFTKFVSQTRFSIMEMMGNAGAFDYDNIGPNHNALQVLLKHETIM